MVENNISTPLEYLLDLLHTPQIMQSPDTKLCDNISTHSS
jgi:hypothetical protein